MYGEGGRNSRRVGNEIVNVIIIHQYMWSTTIPTIPTVTIVTTTTITSYISDVWISLCISHIWAPFPTPYHALPFCCKTTRVKWTKMRFTQFPLVGRRIDQLCSFSAILANPQCATSGLTSWPPQYQFFAFSLLLLIKSLQLFSRRFIYCR